MVSCNHIKFQNNLAFSSKNIFKNYSTPTPHFCFWSLTIHQTPHACQLLLSINPYSNWAILEWFRRQLVPFKVDASTNIDNFTHLWIDATRLAPLTPLTPLFCSVFGWERKWFFVVPPLAGHAGDVTGLVQWRRPSLGGPTTVIRADRSHLH